MCSCSPKQVEHRCTEVSKPPYRTSKPTLRILQWNTDGLSTKVQELHDRLAAESIDVCLIQETKLVEKDASPPFQEDIVFQRAAKDYSPPLE